MFRLGAFFLILLVSLPAAKAAFNPDEAKGNNWMSFVPDTSRLSAFTLPGSHDSAARYIADFATPDSAAKTQNLTIREQLDAGVRFLDIRCRHVDNACVLHHGRAYLSINMTDALREVYGFLDTNPSETVVMSVKEPEHDAKDNTRTFEATFRTYLDRPEAKDKWYTGASIPQLGEAGKDRTVRGKIVLLRRFAATRADGADLGIDATDWPDNSAFFDRNNRLNVQDKYDQGHYLAGQKPDTYPGKYQAIEDQLTNAAKGDSDILYLNFTSGVVFTWMPFTSDIPNIPLVSDYINPRVSSYFTDRSGHFGVIVMDFIDKDLSRKIYMTTLRLFSSTEEDIDNDGKSQTEELELGMDPVTSIRLAESAYNVSLPQKVAVSNDTAKGLKIEADNDAVMFQASHLPTGLSVNQKTGDITGSPIRAGQFVSRLRAYDAAGGVVSTRWKFRVEAPLKLMYPEVVAIKSGRNVAITPQSARKSWPRYAISSGHLPEGLFLDNDTGKIRGRVRSSQQGSFPVTVRARNSTGQLEREINFIVIP